MQRHPLCLFTVPLLVLTVASSALAQDDPFLWLEEVEGKKSMAWVRAQNAKTLKALTTDTRYDTFLKEATAILTATDRIPYGQYRGGFVYNFWQDKTHVRGIWRRTTLEQYQQPEPAWELLLDLDQLAKKEKENWVYKGVDCLAPGYTRCMLRLSRGGKDAAELREFDLKKRAFVTDGFHVPEAKSTLSWIDANTLLLGTNWGKGTLTKSGYPRVLKLWKRGTPLTKARTVFEGQTADVGTWAWVATRPEGQLRMVQRSTSFYTSEFHLIDDKGQTQKLPLHNSTKLYGAIFGQAIFSLRKPWEHKGQRYSAGVLYTTPLAPLKQGNVGRITPLYKPTKSTSISGVSMSRDALYLSILDDVTGRLFKLTYNADARSWATTPVELPKTGALRVVSSNAYETTVFINYEDYKTPDELLALNKAMKLTKLRGLPSRFDSRGVNVKQVFTQSADGTRIPYFLITSKGMRFNGQTPTLLYGYGGFEISMRPRYIGTFGKLWLERGGAFAVANIRGGGEYGPRWHRAALKENRQRAYDDFIAVAKDLIKTQVSSPKRLGIMGGSNGGLLVGATFTQRPDLFNAVVCQVPLLDMLRYTQLLAGASWAAEYGDPADPKMAKIIAKYSPYQNLDPQKTYPKVFFITSTKDDRVHPGHARKMAARMLSMGKPVYYFENIDGGHAASANQNERARRLALEFIYLWQQLGQK